MLALLLLSAFTGLYAANGREALNHYGLVTLGNATVEKELSVRFKGVGKPVFLVHDLKQGITIGDVVRFSDKAVLVDAAVLQTLQAVGALRAVNQAAVMRLQARAQSGIWKGRTSLVSSGREKKGYALGSELLKILEDYFGGVPSNEELVIRFDGRDMVLMVPDAMLDRLSFVQVRKVPQSSKPLVVSVPPSSLRFRGDSLQWQVWGADPSEPESQLQYGFEGELPAGLVWKGDSHSFQGVLDSVGEYRWKVWTRNPGGASDTLSLIMVVRENQAPLFAGDKPEPLLAGAFWSFSPVVWDEDHASELLDCHADTLPQGAVWDSLACRVSWDVPADARIDSVPPLVMRVCDPMGACSRKAFSMSMSAPLPSRLSAIRFVLPEDTLLQGRIRHWPFYRMLAPGIRLVSVSGLDSVGLVPDAENGGFFWIKPQNPGEQNLVFRLAEGQDTIQLKQTLFIRPNRPPQFQSTLSSYRVQEGLPLSYKPVAVDPDGDSLRIRLKTADNRYIRYTSGELPLWTGSPGQYTLEFIASDDVNPPVHQRIAYEVEPRRAEWKGVGVRYRSLGPVPSWWAYWRFGSARLGLFTPKLNDVITPAPPSQKEWAYAFVGASFVGDRAMASGSYFWVDMGLQVRRPAEKIWSGGIMIGLDGRYASKNKQYPWAFEFELSVHANQAILVVDTAGWSEVDYRVLMDSYGNNFSVSDINPDSLFKTYLGPSYDKLVEDITARDNFVASLRLETWFPVLDMRILGDLYAAPVYWREEYILRAESHQLAGAGLRQQISWRGTSFTQSLRGGYGVGESDYRYWYDLTLQLGKWD